MAMQKKTILLIQPWIEDYYMTNCRIQPIGLAYLAGSLQEKFRNLNIKIYDALAGGEKRTIAWPKEFSYLKRYYGHPDSSPFSLFHQFYRFGKSSDTIIHDLKDENPFLIGISSLFTPYYRQSLDLASICKTLFPKIPIVMGGSHATMHPQTLLRPYKKKIVCDYIIPGEGEEKLGELVDNLLGEKPFSELTQVVTQNDKSSESQFHLEPTENLINEIKKKTDTLRKLPCPAFTGLNPADYTYNQKLMTFLITSRSCPHRCTFCSIHSVFGTTYVTRTAEAIFSEIKERYNQGIRHFDIEDDNFTVNKKEIHRLLDMIINENLPITFTAMNGLSYISLDRSIIQKMKLAGFSSLNLSLVSSDKLVLEFTDRPHTVDKFLNILAIAESLDLRVTAYFIMGMPKQSIKEIWNTLLTLAKCRCLIGASPFYFTPESPIHRLEKNNPSIHLASDKHGDPYFAARLTVMDLECNEFDRDDIFTLFKLTRVFNYIKRGIDLGYSETDIFFEPAFNILNNGCWYAENGNEKYELPFSKKVANLIRDSKLIIKGYKQPSSFTLNCQDRLGTLLTL